MIPALINCYQLITRLINLINNDDGLEVRSVFLDIAEGFDKANKGLSFKLEQNGISGHLLNILKDILSNKKQRIILKGQVSTWTSVNAGIP